MLTLSGNVYLASGHGITSAPVKMEIDGGDWKVVGYVKDIELNRDVENERIYSDYACDSFIVPKMERHTITAEFTPGPDGDSLWTMLTGEALNGLSVEKPVNRLKRLLRGTH